MHVFFSFLLPLTLATRGGALLPAFFAIGTMLTADRDVGGAGALDRWVRPVPGVVFLLAGVNDTLLCWALG